MTTSQQFLDAITAAPDDGALRLQFADWLEERGNPLCHEWRVHGGQTVVLGECQDIYFEFYTDGEGDGVGDGKMMFINDLPSGDGDGCGKGPGWGDSDGQGWGDGLGFGYSFGDSGAAGEGFGFGRLFFYYD